MIVVSDASPLHYLILIEAEHVLPEMFSELIAPPEVLRELSHPKAPERVRRLARNLPKWLRVTAPSSVALDENLGDGESAAIALAIELQANVLLIDERDGTRVARRRGLATVGTLGVLSMAAEMNRVSLENVFASLQQTSFRIRPPLLTALLAHDRQRRERGGE
jgi:uncharacterized protein